MQKFTLLLLLLTSCLWAQPSLELTPAGFEPVEVTISALPNEKLIELTKSWAAELNRRLKSRYDITDVTENSLTITGYKKNAFLIRNKGETFDYAIGYTMKLSFSRNSYTLRFIVNDIYTDQDRLVQYKIPDYFNSAGELKDGYDELKPTLEKTVNDLALSHYNFIMNFR